MIEFLQRLIRDYLQGGSLLERLGKGPGWSKAKLEQLIEARQLLEMLDPYNRQLQKNLSTAGATANIPVLGKLLAQDTIYGQTSADSTIYLFAYEYAADNSHKDILELLVLFGRQLHVEFQVEFTTPDPNKPFHHIVKVNDPRGHKLINQILALENLQEPLRRLPAFQPRLLKISDKGVRLQFDESLNLGQAQSVVKAVFEISDCILSAREAGRLSGR